MGLFDFFKSPKSEFDDLYKEIFPGGNQEVLFKGKVVINLSNGKLGQNEATKLYVMAKTRYKLACSNFNGETNLGPDAFALIEKTKADSNGKLSLAEASGIVHYVIFDKVDHSNETTLTIKKELEAIFGTDSVGCDSDEIPSAIGEFGLDPTNPIPVRGIASNTFYLRKLRTLDGRKVSCERKGSLTVPNVFGNIDEYAICQDNRNLCKLFISPYNRRMSSRPPQGFILVQQDP